VEPLDATEAQDGAVIIALGSNMAGGYPSIQALLEAAIARLPAAGVNVLARSSWWRSAAWPDPGQPAFLNGVALVDTRLSPPALLAALANLERAFGRRPGAANAPRTLDLDLIAHGRVVIDGADLTVPHPRAHERRFVMGPLAEIAPDWRHPVSGQTAVMMARRATVGADATPSGPPHAALHNRPRNAI
jgi:2-amino-4-hydroxy-6-hydroxymethyldihydropteridine diphosphokinase